MINRTTQTTKAPLAGLVSQDAHVIVPSQPNDVVWVVDREGTPLSVDDRVHDLLGYWADEVVDAGEQLWWRRVHPEDRDRMRAALVALFEFACAFELEYRLQRRDGRWIWVDARAVALVRWEGGFCAHIVMRSAAGRRKAEAHAREAVSRYRAVCATAPVVIARRRQDNDFGLSFVSSNVTALLGYTSREMLHEAAFVARLVHGDDRRRVQEAIRAAVAAGSSTCEYRVLHKGGGHRWIREDIRAMRFDGPSPTELLSYWTLIAEERRWEEASRRLETALQVLGARASDAVAFCRPTAILRANAAFLSALGRASSAVLGRDPRDFVDRHDRAALDALLQEDARAMASPRMSDLRWVHSSGEAAVLRCSSLPILHEGQLAILLIGAPS